LDRLLIEKQNTEGVNPLILVFSKAII